MKNRKWANAVRKKLVLFAAKTEKTYAAIAKEAGIDVGKIYGLNAKGIMNGEDMRALEQYLTSHEDDAEDEGGFNIPARLSPDELMHTVAEHLRELAKFLESPARSYAERVDQFGRHLRYHLAAMEDVAAKDKELGQDTGAQK